MGVTTLHPEYIENLPDVTRTRDAVKGQRTIKSKGPLYLPADFAKSDADRYAVYKERAYFLGATKQAAKSYSGMVFRKPASWGEDGLPVELEQFQYNIDGSGKSIEQLAKFGFTELEEAGRIGFLADYTNNKSGLTKLEERLSGARPILVPYVFESIWNWKTGVIKGRSMLTLVVLRESVDFGDDEFDHDEEYQFRVLRLNDQGQYTMQLYDDSGEPKSDELLILANKKPLDHIPFYIAGTEDNTPTVDQPMLLDLANMNISHYQSTANIEEAAYLLGCPTLHIDIGDMSVDEFASANPSGVKVGARQGLQTQRGKIEMVQASESNLGAEQMEKKIERMKELGAKLVTKGGQNETAEAARINASGEASALDIAVNNLSDVMEKALEDFMRFIGVETEITYRLNTEFWESSLDPQVLNGITGLKATGVIANQDVRYMIRTKQIGFEEGRTDEDIDLSIANDNSGLILDS